MTTADLRARLHGRPVAYDDVRIDLLAPLTNAILTHAEAHPRSAPSLNIGGWKSGEDFFGWPFPAVAQLYRAISSGFLDGATIVGWAMVNANGSHHPRHRHDTSLVSGVYCVQPGGVPLAPTIFEVPGTGDLPIEPREGRLVLFPGSLWHRVPAFHGQPARITIAFDARR